MLYWRAESEADGRIEEMEKMEKMGMMGKKGGKERVGG